MKRPKLTFDGCGINGPDEYRTRLATFNRTPDFTDAIINRYGELFASAPETRAAAGALAAALRGLANIATHPKCTMADRQLFAREAREALAQWEEVTK